MRRHLKTVIFPQVLRGDEICEQVCLHTGEEGVKCLTLGDWIDTFKVRRRSVKNSLNVILTQGLQTHLNHVCPSSGWQVDGASGRGLSIGRRNQSLCCSKVGGRCYSDSQSQCYSACCCLSSWSPSCHGSPCKPHPELSYNFITAWWEACHLCEWETKAASTPADMPHAMNGWRVYATFTDIHSVEKSVESKLSFRDQDFWES